MNAVDHAKEIAARAHAKERRDWWLIRKPGVAEPVPVLFVPAVTQGELLQHFPLYAHCGVIPLLEQVD